MPHLTNHSIKATTVTALSNANIESGHIKAITGHQSEASIQSYCDIQTFEQFKTMSNKLGEFFDPANEISLFQSLIRLRSERFGFESWPGTLCCVVGQETLLSQCLSPPRCINGSQQIVGENLTNCREVTCDGPASHPGEIKILLAASCYRNRDKLQQL